jgi:hypothetical protein
VTTLKPPGCITAHAPRSPPPNTSHTSYESSLQWWSGGVGEWGKCGDVIDSFSRPVGNLLARSDGRDAHYLV